MSEVNRCYGITGASPTPLEAGPKSLLPSLPSQPDVQVSVAVMAINIHCPHGIGITRGLSQALSEGLARALQCAREADGDINTICVVFNKHWERIAVMGCSAWADNAGKARRITELRKRIAGMVEPAAHLLIIGPDTGEHAGSLVAYTEEAGGAYIAHVPIGKAPADGTPEEIHVNMRPATFPDGLFHLLFPFYDTTPDKASLEASVKPKGKPKPSTPPPTTPPTATTSEGN